MKIFFLMTGNVRERLSDKFSFELTKGTVSCQLTVPYHQIQYKLIIQNDINYTSSIRTSIAPSPFLWPIFTILV